MNTIIGLVFILVASALLNSCGNDNSAKKQSIEVSPSNETQLLKNIDPAISANLVQEIRVQTLLALQNFGDIMKEVSEKNGEITWSELNLNPTNQTKLLLGFDASLKTSVENAAQADVKFEIHRSSYNLSYAFVDRNSQETFRFALSSPVEIDDQIKVTASTQLDISAVAFLQPKWLANTIATILPDLNASLKASGSWEKSNQLSTDMVYKTSADQTSTKLTSKIFSDIMIPLCEKIKSRKKEDTKSCQVLPPKFSEPVEDLLKETKEEKVLPIVKCVNTGTHELLAPVYFLYSIVPTSSRLIHSTEVSLYEKKTQSWQRSGAQPKVLDVQNGSGTICGDLESNFTCLKVKAPLFFFEKNCSQLHSGQKNWALSTHRETVL